MLLFSMAWVWCRSHVQQDTIYRKPIKEKGSWEIPNLPVLNFNNPSPTFSILKEQANYPSYCEDIHFPCLARINENRHHIIAERVLQILNECCGAKVTPHWKHELGIPTRGTLRKLQLLCGCNRHSAAPSDIHLQKSTDPTCCENQFPNVQSANFFVWEVANTRAARSETYLLRGCRHARGSIGKEPAKRLQTRARLDQRKNFWRKNPCLVHISRRMRRGHKVVFFLDTTWSPNIAPRGFRSLVAFSEICRFFEFFPP